MITGWIDRGLLRDFQSEGTDSHRLCTIEDGWVERFGTDVLISFKRMFVRERLLEELQTWSDEAGMEVTIQSQWGVAPANVGNAPANIRARSTRESCA